VQQTTHLASADRGAAMLQRTRLMQQRMGGLEPGFSAGWILKHPVGEADHLYQMVQPLSSHQIQSHLLTGTARHRGLRNG